MDRYFEFAGEPLWEIPEPECACGNPLELGETGDCWDCREEAHAFAADCADEAEFNVNAFVEEEAA